MFWLISEKHLNAPFFPARIHHCSNGSEKLFSTLGVGSSFIFLSLRVGKIFHVDGGKQTQGGRRQQKLFAVPLLVAYPFQSVAVIMVRLKVSRSCAPSPAASISVPGCFLCPKSQRLHWAGGRVLMAPSDTKVQNMPRKKNNKM